MSYAIGKVIYGIPMNSQQNQLLTKLISNDFYEDESGGLSEEELKKIEALEETTWGGALGHFGFTALYSAGGDPNAYCGVALGEIDECTNIKVSDIVKFHPTPEQRKEVGKKIAALRPDLRKLADEVSIWVVWASS